MIVLGFITITTTTATITTTTTTTMIVLFPQPPQRKFGPLFSSHNVQKGHIPVTNPHVAA